VPEPKDLCFRDLLRPWSPVIVAAHRGDRP
jgi:hypothetical protein